MEVDLRESKLGHQQNWTKKQVLAGLNHFYKLHSRYPTAIEIDAFEYLPTSRSIQRQFGGLVVLRKELIPNSHSDYTKGIYRSDVAKRGTDRAKKYEGEFYDFLCRHFQPIAIHEHKVIRPGNVASDFFIYLDDDNGIIIDLFYADYLRSLGGVVNIKMKKYAPLPFKSIFVSVGNDEISIEQIRTLMQRRRIPLPDNILIDSEVNFRTSTINQLKKRSLYTTD